MLRQRGRQAGALGLLVWLAAACASSATTPTAAAPTQVARPTTAAPTAGPASATPTQAPLRVETPTPLPSPTVTPTPTATPPCTSDLVFLNDLTIPDGSQFLPGQGIDKQWGVRNAGSCDWDARYRLVLVSGSALGPRSEVALYPARAGNEAVLAVPMQAPPDPGQYMGRWQARDPEGRLFGNVVFVKIEVIALAPPPEEQPPP